MHTTRSISYSEAQQVENIEALDKEIDDEHLMLLGVTLGENTLREVQRRFGPAEQIRVGQDGVLICYRSLQQDDNTMVVFGADSQGGQRLINFQLVAGQQPFRGKEQCASSLLVSKEVATKSGLKIGLNAETVRSLWGGPMIEKNGHFQLEYDYHKVTTHEERPACLLIFSRAVIRFVEGKLAWLLITRGTEGFLGPCNRTNRSPE